MTMQNVTSDSAPPRLVPERLAFSPVIISVLLVLWTAAVYPFSVYGDNWAIWPALLALPTACLWHATLFFVLVEKRRLVGIAAVCHLAVLVPLWFVCLMLISKDSL